MSEPITAEAVRAHLTERKDTRLNHIADMEAISVIGSKHDRERKAQEEAQRRIHERFVAEQQRIQRQEEELRVQEEMQQAQWAENCKGFQKAVLLAGILCGFGGLNLVCAWRPDFAMVTGGVFVLAGITTIALAAAALYRGR